MFGELFLVGLAVSVVVGVLISAPSVILLAILLGAILTFHASVGTVVASVGIGILLFMVPGVLLVIAWSVAGPVVILERPGRLRALRRSRMLVRGSRLRVLGTILGGLILVTLATRITEIAALAAGRTLDAIARLALGTFIAPIPFLLSATLYFELHRISRDASTDALTTSDPPPSAR